MRMPAVLRRTVRGAKLEKATGAATQGVLKPNWSQLLSLAQEEVRATIEDLPEPVRQHAAPLPVTYERQPSPGLLADNYDPDLLGLFVGAPLSAPEDSPLPPQIILFLENLWDFADGDEQIYLDEVQITYLHELGHYLGLDEIDLEERGLE
jgi:predicted Zn-dependent protease with MMP-like domain